MGNSFNDLLARQTLLGQLSTGQVYQSQSAFGGYYGQILSSLGQCFRGSFGPCEGAENAIRRIKEVFTEEIDV